VQIGKLDDRVTLQSESNTTNDFGEVIKSYVDVETVWADVISRKGDESFQAASMRSERVIKIKIRYRTDVVTKWRIKWNDEFYNIIDVDRSLRRKGELWLMCENVEAV
jgi:SPP1 family predicted phage head-tail adaptor